MQSAKSQLRQETHTLEKVQTLSGSPNRFQNNRRSNNQEHNVTALTEEEVVYTLNAAILDDDMRLSLMNMCDLLGQEKKEHLTIGTEVVGRESLIASLEELRAICRRMNKGDNSARKELAVALEKVSLPRTIKERLQGMMDVPQEGAKDTEPVEQKKQEVVIPVTVRKAVPVPDSTLGSEEVTNKQAVCPPIAPLPLEVQKIGITAQPAPSPAAARTTEAQKNWEKFLLAEQSIPESGALLSITQGHGTVASAVEMTPSEVTQHQHVDVRKTSNEVEILASLQQGSDTVHTPESADVLQVKNAPRTELGERRVEVRRQLKAMQKDEGVPSDAKKNMLTAHRAELRGIALQEVRDMYYKKPQLDRSLEAGTPTEKVAEIEEEKSAPLTKAVAKLAVVQELVKKGEADASLEGYHQARVAYIENKERLAHARVHFLEKLKERTEDRAQSGMFSKFLKTVKPDQKDEVYTKALREYDTYLDTSANLIEARKSALKALVESRAKKRDSGGGVLDETKMEAFYIATAYLTTMEDRKAIESAKETTGGKENPTLARLAKVGKWFGGRTLTQKVAIGAALAGGVALFAGGGALSILAAGGIGAGRKLVATGVSSAVAGGVFGKVVPKIHEVIKKDTEQKTNLALEGLTGEAGTMRLSVLRNDLDKIERTERVKKGATTVAAIGAVGAVAYATGAGAASAVQSGLDAGVDVIDGVSSVAETPPLPQVSPGVLGVVEDFNKHIGLPGEEGLPTPPSASTGTAVLEEAAVPDVVSVTEQGVPVVLPPDESLDSLDIQQLIDEVLQTPVSDSTPTFEVGVIPEPLSTLLPDPLSDIDAKDTAPTVREVPHEPIPTIDQTPSSDELAKGQASANNAKDMEEARLTAARVKFGQDTDLTVPDTPHEDVVTVDTAPDAAEQLPDTPVSPEHLVSGVHTEGTFARGDTVWGVLRRSVEDTAWYKELSKGEQMRVVGNMLEYVKDHSVVKGGDVNRIYAKEAFDFSIPDDHMQRIYALVRPPLSATADVSLTIPEGVTLSGIVGEHLTNEGVSAEQLPEAQRVLLERMENDSHVATVDGKEIMNVDNIRAGAHLTIAVPDEYAAKYGLEESVASGGVQGGAPTHAPNTVEGHEPSPATGDTQEPHTAQQGSEDTPRTQQVPESSDGPIQVDQVEAFKNRYQQTVAWGDFPYVNQVTSELAGFDAKVDHLLDSGGEFPRDGSLPELTKGAFQSVVFENPKIVAEMPETLPQVLKDSWEPLAFLKVGDLYDPTPGLQYDLGGIAINFSSHTEEVLKDILSRVQFAEQGQLRVDIGNCIDRAAKSGETLGELMSDIAALQTKH